MKKILTCVTAFIFISGFTLCDDRSDKPFIKDLKLELAKKNKIFNLNIDLQLGLSFSNSSFELNKYNDTTNSLSNTSVKTGPSLGAILSVDFFGYGFTSGFTYSSKGFKTADNKNTSLNYFNIPLLFYFDFDIDRVIIDGNFGPYFGLMLSDNPSTVYSVKNFDFGLTGCLQGAYLFEKNLGALLGVKYEYGGLNNLGSNENVKSIRTSTFFVYSGIKFIL